MRLTNASLMFAMVAPMAAYAQSSNDSLNLLGRTTLSVAVGLTGSTTESVSGSQVSSHTSGQVGSLALNHWVRPELAFGISAALLNADATTGGTSTHSAAIMPVLFGLSLSPRMLAVSSSIRPYISAAAGPYIHAVSDVSSNSSTGFVESVAGAKLATGVDWLFARHVFTRLEGDYHAVGSFAHTDALTTGANGFGLSLGIGVAWGGAAPASR